MVNMETKATIDGIKSRRASLYLQLYQYLAGTPIVTKQWSPLAALPVSGQTISTSQLYRWLNSTCQHPPTTTCQSHASYRSVQRKEKHDKADVICFPCEGALLVFLPPEELSWWVRIKRSRDTLTKLFVATRADSRAVCNSHSRSVWTYRNIYTYIELYWLNWNLTQLMSHVKELNIYSALQDSGHFRTDVTCCRAAREFNTYKTYSTAELYR